jgi:MerR family transcriptional regulator/heat shock protein HspR
MRVRIVFDENVRDDEPIYVISKAAELAGMHPQTLRQYDRLGLVSPRRTSGRGRRYSKRDVAQLVEIQRLSHDEGINLAGIKRILDLENQVRALEARVELLAAQAKSEKKSKGNNKRIIKVNFYYEEDRRVLYN